MKILNKIKTALVDAFTADHSPEPERPIEIPKWVAPEPTEEEILSAKLRDIILSDFEKYPPHEWTCFNNKLARCRDDTYIHPCLKYEIRRQFSRIVSGRYYFIIKIDGTSLPLLPSDNAYIGESFMNKIYEFNKQEQERKQKDAAEIMFDESTRIVCKEE